jgi:hypothetical protein
MAPTEESPKNNEIESLTSEFKEKKKECSQFKTKQKEEELIHDQLVLLRFNRLVGSNLSKPKTDENRPKSQRGERRGW